MTGDRLDFSALEPTARWDATVERTLAQLDNIVKRRTNPLVIVERWNQRILAAAALVLLLCGTRIVHDLELEKTRTDAARLAAWALAGDRPAGGVIADLLTRAQP